MKFRLQSAGCRMGIPRAWRLALLSGLCLLARLPQACADGLTFDDALALAVRDNPQVLAARSRIEAAELGVVSAGELPDPRLALGVENFPVAGPDRYSLVREQMTMQRVALMQDIPNRAKREARVAVATAQAARSEVDQALTVATLRRESALAWIRRHTVERQLVQLEQLFAENRHFAQALAAQLSAGKVPATDAVLPRQEAAMLDERRDELLLQRQQAIAGLRRWIGEAAGQDLQGALPDWALQETALGAALHRHPELQAVEANARLLDAQVEEAEAARHPDWSVEVAYQHRGPVFGDMVSVQLSFDLPIFADRRQDPQVAARRAEREALEADRDALRRQHAAELASDWAEFEQTGRVLERNRDVLQALAQEKIDLAMAAYASGRVSLSDVIAARRERFELQLKQLDIEGQRALVAARLHYAVQDPVTAEVAP